MSIGWVPPAGPGGFPWFMGEPYSGDPTVAPGLARPIGWEVRRPDGTAAWLKTGLLDTDWTSFAGLGPGPPPATPTLEAVYAAGAANRVANDFMGMLSGTSLRFQANSDANPLPLVGVYETAASKPLTTSGYPSIAQSLATDLSILIGGRVFNWYEMFDPAWTGTFPELAGYAWEIEPCSFEQTATTAWRRAHVFADRRYTATKNWQPQATPPGPLGSGPGTMLHLVQLYNTLDDTLEPIDQLDGFGQNLREVSPFRNGVIYETATHFSHRLVSVPAANDGVGWGVWDGDMQHGGDVPRLAVAARQVGASAAGDWYWAWSIQDTAGDGQLHDVATFMRTGITFGAPITLADSQGGGSIVQTWRTPTIDFLGAVPAFYAFNTPAVAGKKLVTAAGRFVILTRDANVTVGPIWAFAQNGVDFTATGVTPAPGTFNVATVPNVLASLPTVFPLVDTSVHPLQLHVTQAASGGGVTTFTGYIEIVGTYQ